MNSLPGCRTARFRSLKLWLCGVWAPFLCKNKLCFDANVSSAPFCSMRILQIWHSNKRCRSKFYLESPTYPKKRNDIMFLFFSRYQTLLEMGGKGGSAFSLICRKTKCIVSKENLPPCPSNHHSSPALRKFSKFLSISKLEGEIDTRSREQTLETRAISAKTIFDPHKNLVWRIIIGLSSSFCTMPFNALSNCLFVWYNIEGHTLPNALSNRR